MKQPMTVKTILLALLIPLAAFGCKDRAKTEKLKLAKLRAKLFTLSHMRVLDLNFKHYELIREEHEAIEAHIRGKYRVSKLKRRLVWLRAEHKTRIGTPAAPKIAKMIGFTTRKLAQAKLDLAAASKAIDAAKSQQPPTNQMLKQAKAQHRKLTKVGND